MVTYRCGSGARTRSPKSRLQATSSGCEDVHLRINCTIHMPAEIGPKHDCALTRAGCYFDSSLTMCGAEVFALRRERCVRAIAILARAFRALSAPWLATSVIDISGILPRSLHIIACDNTKRLRRARR